jgi:hypothetical protein
MWPDKSFQRKCMIAIPSVYNSTIFFASALLGGGGMGHPVSKFSFSTSTETND